MIPYMHRHKRWDDLVGLDDSRAGRTITAIRMQNGHQVPLEIGYYEFHRDYLPVSFEDIVLLHDQIGNFVETMSTALENVPTPVEEPAPRKRQRQTILFDDELVGVPKCIQEDDVAAMPISLLRNNTKAWQLWADQNGYQSRVDENECLLIWKP